MCLAIFKPKNQKMPSEKNLSIAWENNPDGAGLAVVTKSGVEIIKGFMTLDSLLYFLNTNEKKLEGLDVLLHFRWATSGPKNNPAEMCHPFPVSKKNDELKSLRMTAETAIIHNGVLFPPMMTDYSDTAIFSRFLASKKPSNDEIAKIVGPSNKIAIATKAGVNLIGKWEIINGVFFSNTYSLESRKLTSSAWLNEDLDEIMREGFSYSDLEFCPCCGSDDVEMIGVRAVAVECLECGTIYNETQFLEGNFVPVSSSKNEKRRGA
jgi:hypothetical protein